MKWIVTVSQHGHFDNVFEVWDSAGNAPKVQPETMRRRIESALNRDHNRAEAWEAMREAIIQAITELEFHYERTRAKSVLIKIDKLKAALTLAKGE